MNREQANAWRISQGLSPITESPAQALKRKMQEKRQRDNRAEHAEIQRNIRNMRSKKGK